MNHGIVRNRVILALIFRRNAPALNFSVKGITLKSVMGAVLLPLGAALIVLAIATQMTRVMRFGEVDMSASPVSLIGMIVGAVGEETGWRGFLHRRLHRRLNGLVSSLIVGIPWALWHIGLYQNGPLYMGFLVLLVTSYAMVLYVLVEPISFVRHSSRRRAARRPDHSEFHRPSLRARILRCRRSTGATIKSSGSTSGS